MHELYLGKMDKFDSFSNYTFYISLYACLSSVDIGTVFVRWKVLCQGSKPVLLVPVVQLTQYASLVVTGAIC